MFRVELPLTLHDCGYRPLAFVVNTQAGHSHASREFGSPSAVTLPFESARPGPWMLALRSPSWMRSSSSTCTPGALLSEVGRWGSVGGIPPTAGARPLDFCLFRGLCAAVVGCGGISGCECAVGAGVDPLAMGCAASGPTRPSCSRARSIRSSRTLDSAMCLRRSSRTWTRARARTRVTG